MPPAEVPDWVLLTVLFTDIVGSTETAAELGDAAWRRLLDRHDETVRRYLRRYQGREVKATGDGFLAVFDGPARASSGFASLPPLAVSDALLSAAAPATVTRVGGVLDLAREELAETTNPLQEQAALDGRDAHRDEAVLRQG